MRFLPIVTLLGAGFLLSGCAVFGVAALGGAATETATADDSEEASNGLFSAQWKAACDEIGGRFDPKTGDCDGDLIGYALGEDETTATK